MSRIWRGVLCVLSWPVRPPRVQSHWHETKDEDRPPPAYKVEELQCTAHLPRSIVCPITSLPMADPVVTSDGHSYEREAILRWFATRRTSPCTGMVLDTTHVIPNHALRATVHELLHPDE